MKDITIIGSEKKLTGLDIELLEEKLGVFLPPEYKNFLFLHNGGHPEKDCYPMVSRILKGADIAWFYAFYDGEHENILKEAYRCKGIIPETFLPIARGSGGNEICLGISGNVLGQLYFFIRHWEIDENGRPLPDEMCKIANTFNEFINSLYSIDVIGTINDKGLFAASKYIYEHDKHSILFSTEAKKHGDKVIGFFAQAPTEIEDYIIEETESTKDLLLWYEVASKGKKYFRKISVDGQIEDYQESF